MKQVFAVKNKTQIALIEVEDAETLTVDEVLAFVNKDRSVKQKYTTLTNMKGKHLCKYCHEIVTGTDEDVLCKDCRETFGHSFYSEL